VLKPIAATSAPLADEPRNQVSRLVCDQMGTRSKSEGVYPGGLQEASYKRWDPIWDWG
jgi:hypothetical protein